MKQKNKSIKIWVGVFILIGIASGIIYFWAPAKLNDEACLILGREAITGSQNLRALDSFKEFGCDKQAFIKRFNAEMRN